METKQEETQFSYADLIHRAHAAGLKQISTRLVQAPHPENDCLAIVTATVELAESCFTGIGDARELAGAELPIITAIATAEIRAKAKALRDGLDISSPCREELSTAVILDVAKPQLSGAPQNGADKHEAQTEVTTSENRDGTPSGPSKGGDQPATANQIATIVKLRKLLHLEPGRDRPITTVEASAEIAELARKFNGQGGRVSRSQSSE